MCCKHVILHLHVLNLISLLQVALVEVKKLTADHIDVLGEVTVLVPVVLNLLVEVFVTLAKLLLHERVVLNLFLQLDKLLTLLSFLFLDRDNLFKLLHFLPG